MLRRSDGGVTVRRDERLSNQHPIAGIAIGFPIFKSATVADLVRRSFLILFGNIRQET